MQAFPAAVGSSSFACSFLPADSDRADPIREIVIDEAESKDVKCTFYTYVNQPLPPSTYVYLTILS
jgi:hypothetical protein